MPLFEALKLKGRKVLVWDETDILVVLETEPEVEENGIWHNFEVTQDKVTLKLTIYQYDADVRIELFNGEKELFSMQVMDCPAIKRTLENGNEWLDIAPAKCFGSRYDGETTIPYGARISIKPNINIKLYG